jgi:hypothetical protein
MPHRYMTEGVLILAYPKKLTPGFELQTSQLRVWSRVKLRTGHSWDKLHDKGHKKVGS